MECTSDWRSWLVKVIARDEASLREEEARLAAIRSGRRLKPRNMGLGWTDQLAAQTAYVLALDKWITHLREPDVWLLAFLGRGDFGSSSWRYGFEERRTQFFRKHAGEPSWERSRPRYAAKRRKDAARRQHERQRRTGPIIRKDIYERDRGICGICGQLVPAESFHLDHIDPAGPHGAENLRVTHPLCNVRRGFPGQALPGSFRYSESSPG